MKIHLLSVLVLVLISAGCKKKKDAVVQDSVPVQTAPEAIVAPQINPKDTVLYYERGACFGTCPIFSFVVYADGKGIYNGKNHVNRIGLYQTKVNDSAVHNIIEVANKIGYFGMQELYDNPHVTDLPTIRTGISQNGKLKKVASRYKAPQSLKTLYQELDSLIENQNWNVISKNQSNN